MRSLCHLSLILTFAISACQQSQTPAPAPVPTAPPAPPTAAVAPPVPAVPAAAPEGYLQRRAAHPTRLLVKGLAQPNPPGTDPPEPAQRVTYRSGDLELAGWLAMPAPSVHRPIPVLVYFHGGLGLTPHEFARCKPYLKAGFAVFTPTLRGRNGNPGNFELVFGEVDDARAAIKWIAEQPGIDKSRIYAFGHSMGGGAVAMLTLYPDLPVRLTASAGGIYSPATFSYWAEDEDSKDLIRFDIKDKEETELRVLLPHAAEMKHDHIAYMGTEETTTHKNALALQEGAKGAKVEVVELKGDHFTALDPALAKFLARVRSDAPQP